MSNWYLTNSDSSFGPAGADFRKELSATQGSEVALSVSLGKTETRISYAPTVADQPGVTDWDGTWTVYVDVSTAHNAGYLSVAILRYNSAGALQETKDAPAEQNINTTGVKTFSFGSLTWTSPSATDRFILRFTFRNNANPGITVAIDTGTTYVATPITAAEPFNGTALVASLPTVGAAAGLIAGTAFHGTVAAAVLAITAALPTLTTTSPVPFEGEATAGVLPTTGEAPSLLAGVSFRGSVDPGELPTVGGVSGGSWGFQTAVSGASVGVVGQTPVSGLGTALTADFGVIEPVGATPDLQVGAAVPWAGSATASALPTVGAAPVLIAGTIIPFAGTVTAASLPVMGAEPTLVAGSSAPAGSFSVLDWWIGGMGGSAGFSGTVTPASLAIVGPRLLTEVETYGVLQNDYSPVGNPIEAVLVTDIDPTEAGSLTFYSDGSFTFTPDPDYSGTATFTYKAVDTVTLAESDPETVTITVFAGPSGSYSVLDWWLGGMGATPSGPGYRSFFGRWLGGISAPAPTGAFSGTVTAAALQVVAQTPDLVAETSIPFEAIPAAAILPTVGEIPSLTIGGMFAGVVTAAALPCVGAEPVLTTGTSVPFTGTATAADLPVVGADPVLTAGSSVAFTGTATAAALPVVGEQADLKVDMSFTGTAIVAVLPLVGCQPVLVAASVVPFSGTVTPAELPINGQTPTLATGYHAEPTAADLPTVGETPTLYAGLAFRGTVTPAALPVNGTIPTITHGHNLTVDPAELPVTGATPSLIAGLLFAESVTAAELTVHGETPTLGTGIGFYGVATAAEIGISGETGAITHGHNLTVEPGGVPTVGGQPYGSFWQQTTLVAQPGVLTIVGLSPFVQTVACVHDIAFELTTDRDCDFEMRNGHGESFEVEFEREIDFTF